MEAAIRIVIVDDAPMFRQAIRQLLQKQPNFEIVGEAANGHQALELAETRRPGVMLMDYSLPYMNGLVATREIKNHYPETYVVLLSMFAENLKKEATQSGVCLCLAKDGDLQRLPKMLIGGYLGEG